MDEKDEKRLIEAAAELDGRMEALRIAISLTIVTLNRILPDPPTFTNLVVDNTDKVIKAGYEGGITGTSGYIRGILKELDSFNRGLKSTSKGE